MALLISFHIPSAESGRLYIENGVTGAEDFLLNVRSLPLPSQGAPVMLVH